MAERQEYLTGKCMYAHVHAPDKYGNRSLNLYLDDASKLVWQKLRAEGILNKIATDQNGEEFVRLKSPAQKKIRGELRAMDPVHLIKDGLPYVGMIGDGSDVTCMITVYTYKKPVTQEKGTAIRLRAVKILNLVEPTLKQFPPDGQEKAAALIKQPEPIW